MLKVGELTTSRKVINPEIEQYNTEFIQELARKQDEVGAHYVGVNCGSQVWSIFRMQAFSRASAWNSNWASCRGSKSEDVAATSLETGHGDARCRIWKLSSLVIDCRLQPCEWSLKFELPSKCNLLWEVRL